MRYVLLTLVLSLVAVAAFAEYPPEGWTTSITEAINRAEKDDKMILLDFLGSDWCGWCEQLEKEVWETPEFIQWADDNLIKVFIDFPQNIELTKSRRSQNRALKKFFGVRGYPTVFLLDSDLTPLLKTGYRKGGAKEYIRHLMEDRNIEVKSPETFSQEFREFIENNVGAIP